MRRPVAIIVWVVWFLSACSLQAALRVVTTIFPLYDWSRVVGGAQVEVTQLLPPGVEAHSYAPRPSDLLLLTRADVFVYLSGDMEPWAEDLVKGLDQRRISIIEAAAHLGTPGEGEDGDHDEEGGDEHAHHHAHGDPHVWLDPLLAKEMVSRLAERFAEKDPEHGEYYRANAAGYLARLDELDSRIRDVLAGCERRTILYAGHFAFGCFARRYGLEHLSPYAGFSPNAQPGPRAVAQLIRTVQASGSDVIFHEELVEPRVARIIAEETGARLVMLHGGHNTTAREREEGVSYLSIMESNLQKLRGGLGCP